jgi:hypothetical protein
VDGRFAIFFLRIIILCSKILIRGWYSFLQRYVRALPGNREYRSRGTGECFMLGWRDRIEWNAIYRRILYFAWKSAIDQYHFV